MVNMTSILYNTDSYKVSMWKQYPPGTEIVYSYIEARGGIFDATVLFGVQAFIQEYLTKRITRSEVFEASEYWNAHGEPFNLEGWLYIVDECNGELPVRIKSVQEGTVVPTGKVLVTIENTDPKVPWLTTWIETALLRAVWYPSSVATLSREIKKVIKHYLEKSGGIEGLAFKLHDFGARGASSRETASLGAMAHLVNFMGTDTYVGAIAANKFYGADLKTVAFSIPAAEHSTITSWGRDNEVEAYANQVKQFGDYGAVYAVVSDSYDIYEACRMWGTVLKEKVLDANATLVIRPDSGDPCSVLPKMLKILANNFGYTTNAQGYFVLNKVRLIWGDGINLDSIKKIYEMVVDNLGWSAENLAFGMGGALLNHIQRDDLGWAMKCSAVRINGKWQDVFKDPVTSKGKKSKAGRVVLYKTRSGDFYSGVEDWDMNSLALATVFENGVAVGYTHFEDVRANAAVGL
jgi:nicotinamide phosphoribosyltransferase